MRTQVFAYMGFVGIASDLKAEGLINDPTQPGQMGFIVEAKFVDISKEAMTLLKKVKRSHDAIGDVDVFSANKEGVVFAWLGGPLRMLDVNNCEGSRTYDANLLKGVSGVVLNRPPKDFMDAVERRVNK